MNGKGQGQLVMIITLFIVGAGIIGAAMIIPLFYDIETISGADGTTGELDIDEDTLEDIQEKVDDLYENVSENFDFENMMGYVFIFIIVVSVIFVLTRIISR